MIVPGSGNAGRRSGTAQFEALWSETAPTVFAWTRLRIGADLRAHIDAEDVLQEVAYRAFGAFERFDAERGSFRTWVFGIARNVMMHALQRVGRPGARASFDTASWTALPDTTTSISRRIARSEELQSFVAEVEKLDENDRRLLMHRGLEGLPHEEVAQVLGVSTEAAIKRWTRLRERLTSARPLIAIAD